MIGQRFRLNAPKIGLVFQDGKEVAVEIPAGAEILAIDSVPDPDGPSTASPCHMGRKDDHDVCGGYL
jgi:hypothetical protein